MHTRVVAARRTQGGGAAQLPPGWTSAPPGPLGPWPPARGTAASWVDLHPAGVTSSDGLAVGNGQQVGYVGLGGGYHASLWSGTASSWVDLAPAGSQYSYAYGAFGGQQVGHVYVNSQPHAS